MLRKSLLTLATLALTTGATAQRTFDTDILAETFGFDLDDMEVAYTASLLEKKVTYSHKLAGQEATVTLADDGTVTMRRGGKTHHPIRVFSFAWYTFHPKTRLWQ
jgi:hypothetical protein